MDNPFERTIAALEKANVRYLIVGGVAVVLHGYLRTTADLDLIIDLSEPNVQRAIETLTGLGLRPRLPVRAEEFADAHRRREWVETKGMTVFSMWDPARPGFSVDLFADPPLDFDEAFARSLEATLERTAARVVSLGDLVEMKRLAGRPRDLEDVLQLESLARLGAKEE